MEDFEPTQKGKNQTNTSIRFFFIVVGVFLVGVSIQFKAFTIAITQRTRWIELSKANTRSDVVTYPKRGDIYADDKELMATTMPIYHVKIDFKADGFDKDEFLHSKTDNVRLLAKSLSQKFGDYTSAHYLRRLMQGLKSGNRGFCLFGSKKISYFDLQDIKSFPWLRFSRNHSGMYYKEMSEREKPFGNLASRTIGDIYGELEKGGVSKGKNGLELCYDSLLSGRPGVSAVKRLDGRWIKVPNTEPENGRDICSTIKIQAQEITQRALLDELRATDAESGTAILMEVKTGRVKAITNLARLSKGNYAETVNYAVADMSEPGSTFKVASMMVALEDGVCTPTDTVDTGKGVFYYKRARMTDHNMNHGGFGRITAQQAIWYSSNIGVAKLILKGYESRPDKYLEGLRRIGIGTNLHLEIPGSAIPVIRTPKSKYWSKTSLAWMSFGYETQIPPISTLAFYNAIANGGKFMRPYFVEDILNKGEIEKHFEPQVVKSSICSSRTLRLIQKMLREVVTEGTGKTLLTPIIAISGKSGTAQIANQGSYTAHGRHYQVSFCGYFPSEDPKYSCICVIRKPRVGYPSGGHMAGGVVCTIAKRLYANETQLEIDDQPKDTAGVFIPYVKAGRVKQIKKVLDDLNVDVDRYHGDELWAHTQTTDKETLCLKGLTIKKGLVPNVYGMGARDAVYLLESKGLQVKLSGYGTVRHQSLRAGTRLIRGTTVSLTLR